MSTWIVFQQMLVVFILITVGFFMFRSGRFSRMASKDLSGLITNVCNPAIMIGSAFGDNAEATAKDVMTAALVAAVMYVVLLVMGWILPRILCIAGSEQKFYSMMTVYGNIGFIGIPLVSAVLGSSALIYLSVFILMFNILIYTHGIQVITSEAQGSGFQWKRMINVGTISGVLTILIFVIEPPVHQVLSDSISYIGGCTTFLSMLVLGGSIANMSVWEVFGDKKLYLFTVIRFFLVPIAVAVILKPLIANDMIRGITVFCLALPVANMPLMLAQEYNTDTKLLARGIILTTLLSIFSVTLSAGFI
ncbi:AEC family transporter [Ruminococcus sp. OA3]|uniref:AEC family transporter n=1 Tax=Ruminococcus sp. OA3 TaxID=2914164 RepID=UPI001F06769C|nr:AEC family transporter [Ruminococcus sp. OA3]MCH1982760.1 AEC family transporter [Ruminococcus sp. OA3]